MKTREPLVSVIIPVYNGERYIKACIENMLTQSYKNLEIIVVDDGSTDSTTDIVKQFSVKLVEQGNQGVSAARNAGIDVAAGEYIHFMDVDDLINTDYYKLMVEAIVETKADIACGGMINEKNRYKTQRFKERLVYKSTKEKLKVTYAGRWGYVWRYLFDLKFLKKNNLRFPEGKIIEDLIFSLPAVFFANKIVVVPKAIYTYLHRPDSQMNNKEVMQRKKRHEDRKHATSFIQEFAQRHEIRIPWVHSGRFLYILRKLVK